MARAATWAVRLLMLSADDIGSSGASVSSVSVVVECDGPAVADS